jgi:hypothetical protein
MGLLTGKLASVPDGPVPIVEEYRTCFPARSGIVTAVGGTGFKMSGGETPG